MQIKVGEYPFRVVDNRETRYPSKGYHGSDRPITGGAFDNRERYIAQSILTCILDDHYIPTTDEARDIIIWANRPVDRKRYIAQSILTGILLDTQYIPTIDEARDIIAWAGRGVRG